MITLVCSTRDWTQKLHTDLHLKSFSLMVVVALGMELSASHILGKSSTTELSIINSCLLCFIVFKFWDRVLPGCDQTCDLPTLVSESAGIPGVSITPSPWNIVQSSFLPQWRDQKNLHFFHKLQHNQGYLNLVVFLLKWNLHQSNNIFLWHSFFHSNKEFLSNRERFWKLCGIAAIFYIITFTYCTRTKM